MKIEKFGVLKLNIPRGLDLGGALWKLIFWGTSRGFFSVKTSRTSSKKTDSWNLNLGGFKHFFYLKPYLGR